MTKWIVGAVEAVTLVLLKFVGIVLLVIAIGLLINWWKTNPQDAEATGNNLMDTVNSVINWAADQVQSWTS